MYYKKRGASLFQAAAFQTIAFRAAAFKAVAAIAALVICQQHAHAQNVAVFEAGEDGYNTYRIPAIVKASDGSLLAFAEARRDGKGDAGNIDLVMKRSTDKGRTWGPMTVVWDDGSNTCGNPAPVVLNNGRIVMLMTWNLGSDKEKDIERYKSKDTRRVFVVKSDDNGHSWTAPREITSEVKDSSWGWYATGPCHAIVKHKSPHKGRIIVPSNHSERGSDTEICSRSQILWSDDGGDSWNIGAMGQDGGNESTAVELSDGRIMLNMRNFYKTDTLRLAAVSADGGQTWEKEWREAALIEPRCQASILSAGHGRALLFCNPKTSRGRRNLTLSISKNDGASWTRQITVFAGPAAYSDMVMTGRNTVGVLFENGSEGNTYERISFAEINIRKK